MKILPEFVAGLPSEVRKLTELLACNNVAALRVIVHQLLGTCGGYGFGPVSGPASIAEESIKSGQTLERITTDINALIEMIRRIDGYDESKTTVYTEK